MVRARTSIRPTAKDSPSRSLYGGVIGPLLLLLAARHGVVPPLPPDAQLERAGATIGEVRIKVGDIFDENDPRERLPGARLVNRLHPTTRKQVIAERLLFHPGDRFDRRVLDESARLLRTDRSLRDVEVRPVAWDGERVTVEVDARDAWTLNVGASFGHAGGTSSTRFSLEDTNFLGTGKRVLVERSDNVDRATTRLGFTDPAILGSRFRLAADYSQASDGGGWELSVERPFFALDTRWSAALDATSEDRVDSLYVLGHVDDRFAHQADRFELRGGISSGLDAGRVTRWSAGFTWQRDRFAAVDLLDDRVATTTLPPVPPERTLAYPWLGWDWQRDDFHQTQNLDLMGRVEDLQLGPRLHARLGFASPVVGADRNALIFDSTATTALVPAPRGLLRFEAAASGRWEQGGFAHTLLHGGAQAYWRDFGDHQLYAAITGDVAHALDPDQQITLGGDSGLRGYPLRYQTGDARLLLTVEQRVFTDWYPLRLARVGAAAFYDLGRVWGGPDGAARGWLQDIGVGLRLAPSRTSRAAVIHFDLAFPLGGPAEVRQVQWLVRSRSSF